MARQQAIGRKRMSDYASREHAHIGESMTAIDRHDTVSDLDLLPIEIRVVEADGSIVGESDRAGRQRFDHQHDGRQEVAAEVTRRNCV